MPLDRQAIRDIMDNAIKKGQRVQNARNELATIMLLLNGAAVLTVIILITALILR